MPSVHSPAHSWLEVDDSDRGWSAGQRLQKGEKHLKSDSSKSKAQASRDQLWWWMVSLEETNSTPLRDPTERPPAASAPR